MRTFTNADFSNDYSNLHLQEDWLNEHFSNQTNDDLLLIRLKNQIINRYNLEKQVAAQMAIDLLETLNFLDVDSRLVSEYIVK